MDAVKVNCPVDVAAPKLLGSEGFSRDRVTVMDVDGKPCESNYVTSSANALETMFLNKVTASELGQHTSHLPNFLSEDVSKHVHSSGANGPRIPRNEEVQVQRKAGQVSTSGSGCSKRPRTMLLEDSTGSADDTREPSEKTQVAKQKNNLGSKQGDRRKIKVSAKNKYDSFSLKASLASFSSAAAGNSFFGSYGLRTDVHDITKLVDDISLNDLLQGTYECANSGKDKRKKASSINENYMHLVKKACSILQLPRSTQYQNFAEIDCCSNEKNPTCQSSVSVVGNADNGDSPTTDLSSSNKDSCSKPQTPANLLDFSFERPKDTLEHLVLPPPKDLECLLLDAAKPAVTSRNAPDPRPGKQMCRRPSLPTFPWSHSFSGHCRNNSDAGKLLTSRSTCQGRWVKMQIDFSSVGASNSFSNLESLAYDETLVPSYGPNTGPLKNNMVSSAFVPLCEWSSSIAAAATTSHASLGSTFMKEPGGDTKNNGSVEHCPRLLAAARTLLEIATCTSRVNQDGTKWPKKPSQKVMKARKSKSIEKHEVIISSSTSIIGSDHKVRNGVDQTSKRPKHSTTGNKKDLVHINGVRKGSISWSTPKSSRSTSNKSVGDSSAYIIKQSCMTPPPAKILNKTCNSQQRIRKLMRTDWNQECDRQDL